MRTSRGLKFEKQNVQGNSVTIYVINEHVFQPQQKKTLA